MVISRCGVSTNAGNVYELSEFNTFKPRKTTLSPTSDISFKGIVVNSVIFQYRVT